MAVYIILFALTILLAVPLIMKNPTPVKKAVYLTVMFLLMYVISIFRYGIGNDYFSYIRILNQIAEADFSQIFSLGFEPLFALLTKGIILFSTNPEIMYAIYALLILAPVAWAIYRWSDNAWISVAVYLCFTLFYNSLSFIRQSMAVSLLILAYGLMKRKKVVPVLIIGVAAALFHYTAAVFIPLYLLSLIRPTKKYLIVYSSVSVGLLAVCLIMKAAGANPLNLLAQAVSALTGKDYTGYVGTIWFETGFGAEYLIMPLALLAVVLISYFCGWKERPESDMLLQLTLLNASIWSFIVYAFIIERFSMFIFIFSVFTVPSVTAYFAEKAKATETAETVNKKIPGYSKKKSEEKKDNSFLITVGITAGMFAYNCFGMVKNFHGVFPYMCLFPEIQDAIDEHDGAEENREVMRTNADLYTYLIQLKNADCGYLAISTGTQFGGFTPGILRAADYADVRLSVLTEKPDASIQTVLCGISGEHQNEAWRDYTAENGISVHFESNGASVTDSEGKIAAVNPNRLTFVLFDENGSIFDATEFDVSMVQRSANKVTVSDASGSAEEARTDSIA